MPPRSRLSSFYILSPGSHGQGFFLTVGVSEATKGVVLTTEVDGDEEDAVRKTEAMNVREAPSLAPPLQVQEPTVRNTLTVATRT
jgi:hypothetical protein